MAEPTQAKRGRKPRGEVLSIVLMVKGTKDWQAWIEANAETLGLSVAELVDQALTEHAKRKKLPAPPERLLPPV